MGYIKIIGVCIDHENREYYYKYDEASKYGLDSKLQRIK